MYRDGQKEYFIGTVLDIFSRKATTALAQVGETVVVSRCFAGGGSCKLVTTEATAVFVVYVVIMQAMLEVAILNVRFYFGLTFLII